MRPRFDARHSQDRDRRIDSAVRAHERRPRNRVGKPDPPFLAPVGCLYAVTTSVITAASGTGTGAVLGSGTAELYALNTDGTRTDLGQAVTVWTDETTAVQSGALILVAANCGQWSYLRSACSTAVQSSSPSGSS